MDFIDYEQIEEHVQQLIYESRKHNPQTDEVNATIMKLHHLLKHAPKQTVEMAALSLAVTMHQIDGLLEYIDDSRFYE
jgi:hypothetical protein